jgi:hypothetical protein
MNTTPNNGGPAFPSKFTVAPNSRKPDGSLTGPTEEVNYIFSGMSLRDWFAGQALAALYGDNEFEGTKADIAWNCYGMADAMLAARKEPTA